MLTRGINRTDTVRRQRCSTRKQYVYTLFIDLFFSLPSRHLAKHIVQKNMKANVERYLTNKLLCLTLVGQFFVVIRFACNVHLFFSASSCANITTESCFSGLAVSKVDLLPLPRF